MRDQTVRFAPDRVMVSVGRGGLVVPVRRYEAHPPGACPVGSPIRPELATLRCVTDHGSRWYGVERAWIGSDLRMRVQGFDSRFEEMAKWEIAGEMT